MEDEGAKLNFFLLTTQTIYAHFYPGWDNDSWRGCEG